MSTEYNTLISQIAAITHRGDLAGQMPFFVEAANELITVRLSLVLETPTDSNDANAILVEYPNLYLYASLISAYEFINELDMTSHYVSRFNDEVSRYYITATGRTPSPVMGGDYVDGTGSAATPPTTEPPVLIPQGSVTFNTVAEMVATAGIPLGTLVFCVDYATGNDSGVLSFKAVQVGTGTADGGAFIDGQDVQWAQLFSTTVTAKQYGAVGDGIVDDSTPVEAARAFAEANNLSFYRGLALSSPTFLENGDGPWVSGGLTGPINTAGKYLPMYYQKNSTLLQSNSDAGSGFSNLWNYPLTTSQFRVAVVLEDGSTTQPSTTYDSFTSGAAMHIGLQNKAGWDEDQQQGTISDYFGRTLVPGINIHCEQQGGGDMPAIQVANDVYCKGPTPLSYRTAPAGAILQGTMNGLEDGAALLWGEQHFRDRGNNVSAVGPTIRLDRTVRDDGQVYGNTWVAHRIVNTGTVNCDQAINILGTHDQGGEWDYGINTSGVEEFGSGLALLIHPDNKIEFNAKTEPSPTTGARENPTEINNWTMGYSTLSSRMEFRAASVPIIQYDTQQLLIAALGNDTNKLLIVGDTYQDGLRLGTLAGDSYITAVGTGTNPATLFLRADTGTTTPVVMSVKEDGNVNLPIVGAELWVEGLRVVTARQPAIANDTSGLANEAKVNEILVALRTHGLIAT